MAKTQQAHVCSKPIVIDGNFYHLKRRILSLENASFKGIKKYAFT